MKISNAISYSYEGSQLVPKYLNESEKMLLTNISYLKELLAPQSSALTIAPHRDPNPTHPNPILPIALKQERPMMCYIFEREIVQ